MSIHAVDWESVEWHPVRTGIERKTFAGEGATMTGQGDGAVRCRDRPCF